MPEKKERVSTPEDIQAQILFLNDHCCCICHKGPKDGVRVQIHHINEDPSDNRSENLAVLCRDCHDRLKDKLWMGKRFAQDEVKKYKALWERTISRKRKHLEFPPATVKEKILEKVDAKGRIERHIEREISYANGLAPKAFGIPPPVSLSEEKKIVLEEAKQIATSQPSIEKLLSILNEVKKTAEIKTGDTVVLSRVCLLIGDSKFNTDDYGVAEIFYREALNYATIAKELDIVEICLYELGASVGMQGRHREALDYFDRVIKMNKNNADAWLNKSVALWSLSRNEEAISTCRMTIEVGTKAEEWDTVAKAYYNMGTELGRLGKHEEAVNSCLKAIEVGTKAEEWDMVASAYYNMGIELGRLGKHEEAVNSYIKAIELRRFLPDKGGEQIFPIITQLICHLGIRSIQNKNYNQAKELAKRLSQVHLDGKKDGMAKLQVKTMEAMDSIISKKDDTDAFQEFKRLFEKSKKDKKVINDNKVTKHM